MTDIVGSTEHAAELGDRAWRDLVQVHHATVRAALRRRGGREVDTAGDGFFAVFDAPAAAVDCALEVAERVRDLGIEIRAGVHVGEVEQVAGKVGGIAVPIAARIMSGAGPGEVLVSSTVRDLAAGAGLRFEDRGTHELKGVPGEWRIFEASRSGSVAPTAGGNAAQRRAAAVRSMRSRPVWQRRPRLFTGAAVVALATIVAVGLLLWRPWQAPALAAVGENALGVIDIERREIVGSIDVGGRPSAIAVNGETAWVAVAGDNTVARVDLATRLVTRVIDVGQGPTALAVAAGSVWVANSSERSLTRINEDTLRVADTIDVGNRPIAVAAAEGGIWVANAGDNSLVRVDAATGEPSPPIAVPSGPVALVASDAAVWVVSADAAQATRFDPVTGSAAAAPIALPARPTAAAIDGGSVWVAMQDGTVLRIEGDTGRVTQILDVGGTPASIGLAGGVLWIADRSGSVHRVDPAAPATPTRLATTSSPASVASAGTELLVTTHAAATSHRGGTVRGMFFGPGVALDPVDLVAFNAALYVADGLVGHRRVGGGAGAELLPVLASAIPQPTDAGRAWRFQLRPDLVYADGRPVLASDFRRAFERSFQVPDLFGFVPGPSLWPTIVGAEACLTPDGSPVARCDLSEGILVDDAGRTVTFRLTEPDGDFLLKLVLPAAFPVPSDIPMHRQLEAGLPGTGPYMVGSVSDTELRLVRNPRFRVVDARVRPDGFPDEIVLAFLPFGTPPEESVAAIVEGRADYTELRGPSRLPPDLQRQVGSQHAGLLHSGPAILTYLPLDTSRPPFDHPDARRALALAMDRGALVEAHGGSPAAFAACQLLPAGWPGHRPYCPWTAEPDPGGRWKGADLDRARELVDASGTAGMEVTVGARGRHALVQDETARTLEALGYEVVAGPPIPDEEWFDRAQEFHVPVWDYIHVWLGPSTYFDTLRCIEPGPGEAAPPCDEALERLVQDALSLQATDRARAAEVWAEADRRVVDEALWVPLFNSGSDMVSDRVGNVQFHPQYFVLLDQLWVQ
jgi:ABC-type transport system substrate-binding protein